MQPVYEVMDMQSMPAFADNSFAVVVDKGPLFISHSTPIPSTLVAKVLDGLTIETYRFYLLFTGIVCRWPGCHVARRCGNPCSFGGDSAHSAAWGYLYAGRYFGSLYVCTKLGNLIFHKCRYACILMVCVNCFQSVKCTGFPTL